jgi:hypothetical protein
VTERVILNVIVATVQAGVASVSHAMVLGEKNVHIATVLVGISFLMD